MQHVFRDIVRKVTLDIDQLKFHDKIIDIAVSYEALAVKEISCHYKKLKQ